MRVHIATDHAGLKLSSRVITALTDSGYEMVDHRPTSYDPEDDYPAFCNNATTGVVNDQAAGVDALGIEVGGSGNGVQIAANKVKGVRAALAWNLDTAVLAHQRNDANVVAVGGRQQTVEEARELIMAFPAEPFTNAERHERRIGKIATYETSGEVIEQFSNQPM